jgi:protein SCO1/2
VFSPTAAAIFIATGAGLFYYFKSEKESLKKKKGCVMDVIPVYELLMTWDRGRTREQSLR